MSFDSAPKPDQEIPIEEQLAVLDAQIDEAEATYDGARVAELESERAALLSSSASQDQGPLTLQAAQNLDTKFEVKGGSGEIPEGLDVARIEEAEPEIGAALARLIEECRDDRKNADLAQRLYEEYQKEVVHFEGLLSRAQAMEQELSGLLRQIVEARNANASLDDLNAKEHPLHTEYIKVLTQKDELYKLLRRARDIELSNIESKAQGKNSLTKEELQSLYFGRSFSSSNHFYLRLLNVRYVNQTYKGDEPSYDYYEGPEMEQRLHKVGFGDLTVLFNCDSGQIATSPLAVTNRKSDVKVFVGEPSYEMVSLLERQPELQTSIHFFREFPGKTFPVEEMTFEEMKKMVGKE